MIAPPPRSPLFPSPPLSLSPGDPPAPVAPFAQGARGGPAALCWLFAPVAPAAPVVPVGPVAPVGPIGPVGPAGPAFPIAMTNDAVSPAALPFDTVSKYVPGGGVGSDACIHDGVAFMTASGVRSIQTLVPSVKLFPSIARICVVGL